MSRRRLWAAAVAASFVVLAGAVAALTWGVLRYESAERESRRRAAHEADVRLALWRMDAALQPILVLEAARPVWQYRPIDPVIGPPASPLVWQPPEYALLHAELDSGGTLSSPQAMSDARAEELGLPIAAARQARSRLEHLRTSLSREALVAAVVAARAGDEVVAGDQAEQPAWRAQSDLEYTNRIANVEAAYPRTSDGGGRLTPVWIDDRLLLVRSAGASSVAAIQLVWLDWDHLRARLAAAVADLLPGAAVSAAGDRDAPGRRLAALPATLVPGPPGPAPGRAGALWLLLGIAWAGAALALLSVAALTRGAVRLGQRRAEFASAVTHELRTPMTTLCTYTEMLAEGRVSDPARRQRYLETLQREATRLAHLIENVLSWSGIDRGRSGVARETLEAAAVIDRHGPRLAERATGAGMTLAIQVEPGPASFAGDEVAVGQILFNLVDNACKYAGGADDPRIDLSVAARDRQVVFTVIDRGPGIPASARARVFDAFHKSDARAAGHAPGVGLGLALSRRLARAMGGDLVLLEAGPGTRFELRLARRAPASG